MKINCELDWPRWPRWPKLIKTAFLPKNKQMLSQFRYLSCWLKRWPRWLERIKLERVQEQTAAAVRTNNNQIENGRIMHKIVTTDKIYS